MYDLRLEEISEPLHKLSNCELDSLKQSLCSLNKQIELTYKSRLLLRDQLRALDSKYTSLSEQSLLLQSHIAELESKITKVKKKKRKKNSVRLTKTAKEVIRKLDINEYINSLTKEQKEKFLKKLLEVA